MTGEVLAPEALIPSADSKEDWENFLELTNQQLAIALEEAKADVWEADLETGGFHFGDRFIALLGYPPEKRPATLMALAAFVHPDDMVLLMANLRHYLEGASEVFETVVRIRTAKEAWKWYRTRGRAVERDASGRPRRLIGVVIDITETKLAEEELWAAYQQIAAAEGVLQQQYDELERNTQRICKNEASISGIFRVAPIGIAFVSDQALIRINDRLCEITGYSQEELTGKNARFLFLDDQEYARLEGSPSATETRWRRKDGAVQDILLNGTSIDPADPAAGIVFTAIDITEYKKTQKALNRAKEKLSFLNRLTSTDIRNQVFTALGYLQLAGAELTNDGSVRAKELIEKENCVLQKISDSLKFSQTYQDLGFKPARWQNVNQVFLLAISHLSFEKIQRTVTVRDLEIFADPLLENVFYVLAENTLARNTPGTRVTLEYVKQPDESLTILYADNGGGIPPADKDTIFSPDFQKDRSMGLFLAREILETTDITIRETGTMGEGVRFAIRVPKGGYRFGDGC
ncbi:MAG TPA: PAS domain S-box protein [Methanoregulaceae archaeon]|nr:PAS domain S-box protein [Methanoregulaceae archaeon]